MLFLYNLSIKIYLVLLYLARFFNTKAKLWIEGRKNIFANIEKQVDPAKQHIWFHFASLGEFEQGRPVLEKIRHLYPDRPLVITFFSPSGYELRKNTPLADHVFYLPADTRTNARKLVSLLNPALVIFTKYEYWYHYFKELHERRIPLYVISAVFRENQVFFKWYGTLNRNILTLVTHFFVQDEFSAALLKTVGLHNVTVSGDTRFDRVAENAASPKKFPQVEKFCSGSDVFVAGSTWPDDEKLIASLVVKYPEWKFIIAPHEIKAEKIRALEGLLPAGSSIRYSAVSDLHMGRQGNHRVLIIDNIGMLSSLYQYGRIAYIGGGFGVGIHNTLEAAAFAVPVIFGPNYHKFLEAKALIQRGAGFSIADVEELSEVVAKLNDAGYRMAAAVKAGAYVREQQGATTTILNFIKGHELQS